MHRLILKGPTVRNGGGRCRAHGENLERANPVEGELGHENGGVGAFLGTLANGGSRVVDPGPTAGGDGTAEGSMMGELRRLRRDT